MSYIDPKAAMQDLSSIRSDLEENALAQALPLPDIMFGGAVLVFVIMFHAFWIRVISGSFLKRSHAIRTQASLWRANLLFAVMVIALLALHLTEVVIWSGALVFGELARDWSTAAYFAANCYTSLGEPFALPRAWRIVPPIISMSGTFAFALTASVMVNLVSLYNKLRDAILERP